MKRKKDNLLIFVEEREEREKRERRERRET